MTERENSGLVHRKMFEQVLDERNEARALLALTRWHWCGGIAHCPICARTISEGCRLDCKLAIYEAKYGAIKLST